MVHEQSSCFSAASESLKKFPLDHTLRNGDIALRGLVPLRGGVYGISWHVLILLKPFQIDPESKKVPGAGAASNVKRYLCTAGRQGFIMGLESGVLANALQQCSHMTSTCTFSLCKG
jgi:hypothetical protein